MKAYFLNVGYGEAIVLQADDFTVVVDGGSGREAVYQQGGTIRLSQFLQAIGVNKIDILCITHIHEDHIGGLPEVIEAYDIGEIWCNIVPKGDIFAMLDRLGVQARQDTSGELFYLALEAYGKICEIAACRSIPMYAVAGDGQARDCGPLTITPLGMGPQKMYSIEQQFEQMIAASDKERLMELFRENDFNCNSTSLAVHIRGEDFAVLLTGDKVNGWGAMRKLANLRAQVLKVTHHGQKDGMPQDMLEGADPEFIVICADRERTFQSASPEVLRRAEQYLSAKGRKKQIFVTGLLQQAGCTGNVLELENDENCIKASVKQYNV